MESTNVLRSGSSSGGRAEMASIGGGSSDAAGCSGAANDFDLNVGVDLDDEGGLHGSDLSKGAKRKLIDLNEEAVDEDAESLKRLKWFDLNVEPKEDEEERSERAVAGIPTAEAEAEPEAETDASVVQPPPAKVKLPPSSAILDLRGASFFDFISVYAFLRSFSTVLFLSPFAVDEFAASVVCDEATPLFDAVHLSLMRALRRHTSTSTSLRSLNWDLLDSITWPVFLVEYLLLHKPKHITGLNPSELSPLETDYYSMPTSVKVAVLQHLCDDLVETEVFRSELSKRVMMAESDDWKMKYFSSKGNKRAGKRIARSSGVEEKGDECFLCKMDGDLICCDSCPAAMHARCVGMVTRELPKSDWHCPECRLDQGNYCNNLANSIRGNKLLGTDLHGRLYYQVCHYLLVLEQNLCADESSVMVYNRDELAAVVGALDESSCDLHERIIRAISEHWSLSSHEVKRMTTSQASSSAEASYKNLYEFGGMASLISEEMAAVVTARGNTAEQIMKQQLRIIQGGKPSLFSWANTYYMNVYLNSKKEKCGWCFACNNARGCSFVTSDIIQCSDVLGIPPRNGGRKHLEDVRGNIMWIENRLQSHLQDTQSENAASLNKLLLQVICMPVSIEVVMLLTTNA